MFWKCFYQAVEDPVREEPPAVEQNVMERSPSPEEEPPKEVPKLVPGKLAVCMHCGYLSEDFNRCLRCRTKLPEEVKVIPSSGNLRKQQAAQGTQVEKKGISINLKSNQPGKFFFYSFHQIIF